VSPPQTRPSPGPKRFVDERYPVGGVPSSNYSRHKALVESMLSTAEARRPGLRVVRMRTSLVFQRSAGSEIHRLFLGRLLPWHLPRFRRIVPRFDGLAFQATDADDVARAYVSAINSDVSGAFNIAADPVLTPDVIAAAVDGRAFPLPRALVRALAAVSYRARLQPTEPGWLDLATETPLMDPACAQRDLGWEPKVAATEALRSVLDGGHPLSECRWRRVGPNRHRIDRPPMHSTFDHQIAAGPHTGAVERVLSAGTP